MFLEWNADRTSTQYNITLAYALDRSTDVDRLARAFRQVLNAHPVYRMRLVEENGEIHQFVDESLTLDVARLQMSAGEYAAYERHFQRPFDPFSEAPIRVELVETPDGARLLVDVLHFYSDGSSLRALAAEVSAAYDGTASVPEGASFADYVAAEPERLSGAEYAAAAAAARERFAGRAMTVPAADPVTDEPPESGFFLIEEKIGRTEVDAFCARNGIHPNLFFMGAFARTLAAFANERDVVFFTVNHGRRDARWRLTQGALVQTVPVRAELKSDMSLVEFLRGLKLHGAGIYPFTHFCRDLGFTPGLGYVYQEETDYASLSLGGVQIRARDLMVGGAGELPVLQVFSSPGGRWLRMTCRPGRYDTAFLRAFLARLAAVVANFAAADGDEPLARIPVVTEKEARELVRLSAGEEMEYDESKTFLDHFREQAAAAPSKRAVVDAEGALTYGELEAASDALAAQLAEKGVRPGGFVGVMLPRGTSFVVAALAVQKCGAGYVPMDAAYPVERLGYMLSDAGAPVLVTQRALLASTGLAFGGATVCLDEPMPAAKVAAPRLAAPETPAYMIYTSGSTGRPKGVVLSNRALAAMLAWFVRDCGLDARSVNLSITSFSFDASVPDLFPPLAAGGELHILDEDLRKDLQGVRDYAVKVGATGLTTSTQLGLALVNAYPDLPLHYMMLGGEKMVPFAKTAVRMLNGYGPTEFAVCSSYHEVDQSRTYDIPIGRAVPNSLSLVVDRLGALVPRGLPGELALAGPQLAEGYWKQPEKTAAAFVDVPFAATLAACGGRAGRGGRMYRTGDLVRYGEDGELRFLGRLDFQVKLRGFRIEIGEVEQAAASFPGVGAVAAEVREVAGAKHLVLYYGGAVDASALKAHMAKSLTDYMVPDFFVATDPMPLTPNGKIDRRRLPAPALSDEPSVPPSNDAERKVFALVADVLGTDRFGVTHDFGRLGLTSLARMSLLARLRQTCGLALSLRELAERPTVRELAARLGESADSSAAEKPAAATASRPRRRSYPLTENQRGVYADWLRAPDALQYNVPAALRFPGMDPAKLAAAAEKVVAAHPALGTRFAERDGEIVQLPPWAADGALPAVAVETVDAEPDAASLTARLRPFSPQGGELARFTVLASPGAATLFLDIHHTVFDGFSLGVFLRELCRALDGEEIRPEAYSAFDAALDERDYLESELPSEDDRWFERYLDGCESTRFETSTEGADGRPGEAGREAVRIKSAAIVARAADLGVTPSDYFLTAFTELLRRVGRDERTLINFVTAGRSDPRTSAAVGMFVRTLPIRGIAEAATFEEAVRGMKAQVLDLIEHERCSYVRLSEKFGVRPEIIFAFEGGIFNLPAGAELIEPRLGTAKAPLSVTVTPGRDDFELAFEYDRSLYSATDMALLLKMFAQLSESLADAGSGTPRPLRSYPLTAADETAELLRLSYGGALEYDAEKTFVNLFRAQAIVRPAARAVVDCEGAFTYGELDARSDALARRLMASGVKAGGFAGVMLPRRRSFIMAVLAVQKCGAGYVPLDAEYPDDRLAYMLENAEAPVLVTTRALLSEKRLPGGIAVVCLDEEEPAADGTAAAPVNLSTPRTPAYMIYTSGSTGRPKGVVLPNRALAHLVAWTVRSLGLGAASRTATHPSFSFDASVIDIFPTLAAGGELHVYAEGLRTDLQGMNDYIRANGITGGTMSTQIGMSLLDTFPDLPLDYLMLGGEKLLPVAKTGVRILNGYGPTEFTVCSSWHEVDQAKGGDIPIGRPCPGTYSLVVDRYGQLLPRGFVGELALVGPQLADGYWRLPEKTAAAFVDVPFDLPPGGPSFARMYRTGDLARYGESGELDYRGRIDFQVKLRGFRIEIGEVEQAARSFAGVGEVAAEVRDVGGAKHLVLYYASSAPLDEAALRAQMAAGLTDYMVPDFFVRMDPMPHTANGKINRKLLKSPEGAAVEQVYVEPANEVERKIAETYGEVLGLERFGALDDFFASGGTSLIGIKAVVALQKKELDVQYADLFRYKTPRALAAFLQGTPVPAAEQSVGSFDYGAYDYAAVDALLAGTRRELFEGFRRHSLGDVLLCGATGYLGIHVLRYLLESTDSTVTVLVRPTRGIAPARRLGSQYVYYFGERIPRRFNDRLFFVEGDLTDDLAGLPAEHPLVAAPPQTVINCAALVKHYVADDRMERINVGGVDRLIAYCERVGARLVHTSTYSVGGTIRADSAVALDERHLYIGQESDNEYVRTKFVAERNVLAAVAAGRIRAKIMRLGNLMGRESDGEFQMNVGSNAFVNSLRTYKALGAYPLEDLMRRIEMSPIDRVAEACCLLATTPDDMYVFHPFNCYALDMGAVIGALNRRGCDIDWTSRGDFAAHVDALKRDPSRSAELQGILHYAGHLLEGRKVTPAVNDWTTTVLYRLGFRWKPAEDRYLENFFEMLDGLAFFG